MNAFLFYFFHHILLFNLLPLLLHAKLFNGTPAEFLPINSQIYGMKEMPIPNHQQLLGMDNEGKTLADQIMQQMEKSSDGKKENPWTKLLKNEGIEEKDFYKVLEEMREKEQMIGIVFGGEIHQNGPQIQQGMIPANVFFYALSENYNAKCEKALEKKLCKENMEEISKLRAIKENDIEMSQIMVNFLTYTDEIKSTGKVSQEMKKYLLICSEIFAIRLHIPLTKISETKILAKLVKIVLEKKGQNDKEQNGQNDKEKNGQNDKQKREEMLRLLYTAADNINILGDMANKSDKRTKLKRRRRKREDTSGIALPLIIFGVLVIAALAVWICVCRVINKPALNTNDNPPEYANAVDGQNIECALCGAVIEQGHARQVDSCNVHFFHESCFAPNDLDRNSPCPGCSAPLGGNQSNNIELGTLRN